MAGLHRLTRPLVTPASMHILRSHHLSAYLKHVRPQYTTDPYPNSELLSSSPMSSSSEAPPRQETGVLDLYIARATRDASEMWESSLLSTTSDGLEDLFAHHQPRARLADLVVESGIRRRTIMPAAATREKWRGVVAEDVSVDLRSRAASLRLVTATPSPALRTIVEVTRERDEPLETTARHLAMALGRLTIAHHLGPHGRTYQVGR